MFGCCLVYVLSRFGSFRACFGGQGVGDHQKPPQSGPLVSDPMVLVPDSAGK